MFRRHEVFIDKFLVAPLANKRPTYRGAKGLSAMLITRYWNLK